MRQTILATSLLGLSAFMPAYAADYVIDTEKAHAFIFAFSIWAIVG